MGGCPTLLLLLLILGLAKSTSTPLQTGLHGQILLSNPSTVSLQPPSTNLWTKVSRSFFELPPAEMKLLEEVLEVTSKYKTEIEENLKAGKFQRTSGGKYMAKLDKTLMGAAMEKCRTLNGRFLEVNSIRKVKIVKNLLGDSEHLLWQSQIQTPAATYFLSSGEPLPVNLNATTAVKPQTAPLAECEVFNVNDLSFIEKDCLATSLPSICVSNLPPNVNSLTGIIIKRGKFVKKTVGDYFRKLGEFLTGLPETTLTSATTIDNTLIKPWDDNLKLEVSESFAPYGKNHALALEIFRRASEQTSIVKTNVKKISNPGILTRHKLLSAIKKIHQLAYDTWDSTKPLGLSWQ